MWIFASDTVRGLWRRVGNAVGHRRGFGACLHCGDTWNWKVAMMLPHLKGESMFPICTDCFASLTMPLIDGYIDQLIGQWRYVDTLQEARLYDYQQVASRAKYAAHLLKYGVPEEAVQRMIWADELDEAFAKLRLFWSGHGEGSEAQWN